MANNHHLDSEVFAVAKACAKAKASLPHLTRARKGNGCPSRRERIEKNETEGSRVDHSAPLNEIVDLKG